MPKLSGVAASRERHSRLKKPPVILPLKKILPIALPPAGLYAAARSAARPIAQDPAATGTATPEERADARVHAVRRRRRPSTSTASADRDNRAPTQTATPTVSSTPFSTPAPIQTPYPSPVPQTVAGTPTATAGRHVHPGPALTRSLAPGEAPQARQRPPGQRSRSPTRAASKGARGKEGSGAPGHRPPTQPRPQLQSVTFLTRRRRPTSSRGDTPRATERADGTPTLTNPDYALATPGAAPIGVPNFVIDKFKIPPFLLPIYQAAGTSTASAGRSSPRSTRSRPTTAAT